MLESVNHHLHQRLMIVAVTLLCMGALCCDAQQVSRLTITDNMSNASKFGYSKPKPSTPKDHFYLIGEKGTQVLLYADIAGADQAPETYTLHFTAYQIMNGKEEWVDDRIFSGKSTSTYALVAFNFFKEGTYKVTVSGDDQKKIMAEGTFTVSHQ